LFVVGGRDITLLYKWSTISKYVCMYFESIQGHALVGRFVKESIGCKEE
jgi:hypothetical protein